MKTLYDFSRDEVVTDQLWEIPSSTLMRLSNNSTEVPQLVLITGGQFIESDYISHSIRLSYTSQSVTSRFFHERILEPYITNGGINVGFYSGLISNDYMTEAGSVGVSFFSGSLQTGIYVISGSDIPISTVAFYSGSIYNTIITSSYIENYGTSSVAFYSGSIFNSIMTASFVENYETTSVSFYSGSYNLIVPTQQSGSDLGPNTTRVSFLSGYIT